MNDFNQNPKSNEIFGKNHCVFQDAFCFIYKHYAECFFRYDTSEPYEIGSTWELGPPTSEPYPTAVIDFDWSQYLCGKPDHAFILKYHNESYVTFDTTDKWLDEMIFNEEEDEFGIGFSEYCKFLNIFIVHPTPINSEMFFKEYPIWQQLCEAWNEQNICINCKVDWKECKCEKRRQSRLLLNLRFYKNGLYDCFEYPVCYPFFLLCPTSEQDQTLKLMQIEFDFANKKCLLIEWNNFAESDYITQFEKEATKWLDKKDVKVRVNDFESLWTYNDTILNPKEIVINE